MKDLGKLLDAKYLEYAIPEFIDSDPISIPYRYRLKQDIEIAAFFAAIFAWGRRDIIINKTSQLMERMQDAPYDFVCHYSPKDYRYIEGFVHRTFNAKDIECFILALQKHYQPFESLEYAFYQKGMEHHATIESHLVHFYQYMTSLVEFPSRTLRHLSTPAKQSACKRLCLYIKWMVRKDAIDMGIWHHIRREQLVVPLDVHVMSISKTLGLLDGQDKPNWKTAVKLVERLKGYDASDPSKYDMAIFGMGIFRDNQVEVLNQL
jgi:uncharacterized protein (TIGR02757 family)